MTTKEYIESEARATIKDFLGFIDLVVDDANLKKSIRDKYLNSTNRFVRNMSRQFSPLIMTLSEMEDKINTNMI